jgi:hypothetical protein
MDALNNEEVNVVIVAGKNASRVKQWLCTKQILSSRYRMCPSRDAPSCIAIPLQGQHIEDYSDLTFEEEGVILGRGKQICPLKTRELGNCKESARPEKSSRDVNSKGNSMNRIQSAMLQVFASLFQNEKANLSRNIWKDLDQIVECIRNLGETECPSKLEFFGDDSTLVLPKRALQSCIDQQVFTSLFMKETMYMNEDCQPIHQAVLKQIYQALATLCNSPRLVQKGSIDPNSPIRESNCTVLWNRSDGSEHGQIQPGPTAASGWITVTENQIRQSFDMEHVMFSRGNITEKIRFGCQLVQCNETVLDLYAGIGYFTLPALVHGKARHVVACEWNKYAVQALRFNLEDNHVNHRATVFEGDSRKIARERYLVDQFDRVSLGLLPSCEGGWPTAVRALRRATGGWLHVHGNVMVDERYIWFEWLCHCLLRLARDDGRVDAVILGMHLEKVKSFAPKVNHYVADVWIGPEKCQPVINENLCLRRHTAAVVKDKGSSLCIVNVERVPVPSCALSEDGALCQAWMR